MLDTEIDTEIGTEIDTEIDALINAGTDTRSDVLINTRVHADPESRQTSLYFFLKPASLLQIFFSPKLLFQNPKSSLYSSHFFSPARLQILHRLPNCPFSFKTGSRLLIAHGSARFLIRYLSYLNSVSSFAIRKMGLCLLTLLQWHPNRNNSIQIT